MSGRGSSCNLQNSQPRYRGASRRGIRGGPRVAYSSRGRFPWSSIEGPGLTQQDQSSPIFSSPHGDPESAFAGQTNSTSGVEVDEQLSLQQLIPNALKQLTLPNVNQRATPLSSLPSGVHSLSSSLPSDVIPPSSSVRGRAPLRSSSMPGSVPRPPSQTPCGYPVPSKEATLPPQRREDIFMAVDVKKNSLGCAFYTSAEKSLRLLHDTPYTETLQVLEFLVLHIEPTVVLLPLKVSDEVLRFFEKHKDTDDPEKERYILRTLGSNDFNHSTSVDKLSNLSAVHRGHAVVATAADGLQHGVQGEVHTVQVMRLGSYIDIDSVISIGCAGAILGEAIRTRNAQQAPEGPEGAAVDILEMFPLSDFMLFTGDTLSCLQIFQAELHPSTLMSGAVTSESGLRESLSLYGLFHPLAGTSQGRTKLRQTFTRPLVNLPKIHDRHRTITVLLHSDNVQALKNLVLALKNIKDVRKPLELLHRGADTPTGTSVDRGIWWCLARFSIVLLRLRDAVLELQHAQDLPVLRNIIYSVPVAVIKAVGESIESVIDFDEAKASSRIAVKSNVSRELDDLKRSYLGLDSFLNIVRTEMYPMLPEWARQSVTGCVFWPQLGFFTVVSLGPDGNPVYKGQGSGDGEWEVAFKADGIAYCKNHRMIELDNQVGDAYSDIVDLEIQILHSLACEVLKHAPVLSRAADACGDLDCLVALARGAQKYRWTAPTMTEENVIAIKAGRHPLQELAATSFIANDCSLDGGSCDPLRPSDVATLIVTGPNQSGKSVYIKQVALIVYLAHLGSFVPADLATIGVTDQILTRVSTRESLSRNESAFAIDLRQTAFLVRQSTRRSLVVIDEFGKGTSADDGAGLMAGLIDHLTTLGPESPRALIATHFHEIFEGNYLLDHPGLAFAHMDVRLEMAAPIEDQVVFLFHLLPGRSTSSFGSRCAALNGVSEAIVERAEAIMPVLARNEDLGAACARLEDEDLARLEEAELVARRFVELNLEDGSVPAREMLGRLL